MYQVMVGRAPSVHYEECASCYEMPCGTVICAFCSIRQDGSLNSSKHSLMKDFKSGGHLKLQ